MDNENYEIRLPEIKKVAKRLRKHQELLLDYFSVKERLSNSVVEGFNLKAKLTMRRSFGFRTFKSIGLLYIIRLESYQSLQLPTDSTEEAIFIILLGVYYMLLKVKKIEEEALQLPSHERAKLAEHLINSLDEDEDPEVERLWIEEAE
ncbi:MAG: transposase [Candidatus Scalindua sp.]|nr:transposase [Candidatus Scalindua sp.]